MGVLIHQWQALRGELPPEELPQGDRDEEQRVEGLEEPEQQGDTAAEKQQQEDNQEEEQEEEEEEERQEDRKKSTSSEAPEEAEIQRPSTADGTKATEGSAEALLSDLHAFSGSAAWEDGGKHFHITTL
ncbi:UNVERIFIED_CONTAM: hypothetical protein K2H54_008311 [Gekko kuhli]